jgi:hypothetical protein
MVLNIKDGVPTEHSFLADQARPRLHRPVLPPAPTARAPDPGSSSGAPRPLRRALTVCASDPDAHTTRRAPSSCSDTPTAASTQLQLRRPHGRPRLQAYSPGDIPKLLSPDKSSLFFALPVFGSLRNVLQFCSIMEGHQKIEHSFEAFVGGGFGRLQFLFNTQFVLCVFGVSLRHGTFKCFLSTLVNHGKMHQTSNKEIHYSSRVSIVAPKMPLLGKRRYI